MSKCECEKCIHEKVCRTREFPSIEEILKDGCPYFKAKSLFVELSCEVGDVIHLIDKEFINKALINELSRMAYENEEKKAKEMGFVRVKPNLPKPHKPQTNFDKISENEVTLAKFIIDTVTHCQFNNCEDCPLYEADGCSRQEKVKEWLQKEMEK